MKKTKTDYTFGRHPRTHVLRSDYRTITTANITANVKSDGEGIVKVHLNASEISKLIHRFHIWIVATGVLDTIPPTNSRKARKLATLKRIREYRQKGFEVTHRELRLARLNKGAYIPATVPAEVSINGYPMALVEIELEYSPRGFSGAILKLR